MNRFTKILTGFTCCLLGCIIATRPEMSSEDWLNPLLQIVGFVMMLCGGLYGLLKMVRPLIY
jgi:hypothetical protein